jgi:hypothetical protein
MTKTLLLGLILAGVLLFLGYIKESVEIINAAFGSS